MRVAPKLGLDGRSICQLLVGEQESIQLAIEFWVGPLHDQAQSSRGTVIVNSFAVGFGDFEKMHEVAVRIHVDHEGAPHERPVCSCSKKRSAASTWITLGEAWRLASRSTTLAE